MCTPEFSCSRLWNFPVRPMTVTIATLLLLGCDSDPTGTASADGPFTPPLPEG